MYTEEEASFKWCPFSRVRESKEDCEGRGDGKTNFSYNRDESQDFCGDDRGQVASNAHCFASSCMAWRFEISERRHKGEVALAEKEGMQTVAKAIKEHRLGYCGLAGKP